MAKDDGVDGAVRKHVNRDFPNGRNLRLWLLSHEVRDDRSARILGDIARLIVISDHACSKAIAEEHGNLDAIVETECDYIEELIGGALLILQAKIRRVATAALKLSEGMKAKKIDLPSFSSQASVLAIGGYYSGHPYSFVQFVWGLGNYYKHRDEWGRQEWGEHPPRQAKATREVIDLTGIQEGGTGHMRTALTFLGVEPYERIVQLAFCVQGWADQVHVIAKQEIEASIRAGSSP